MAATVPSNFTALAQLFSNYPDQLALHRFRAQHVQNLLYHQAELVQLQRDIQELEEKDAKLHPEPEDRVSHFWEVPLKGSLRQHVSGSASPTNNPSGISSNSRRPSPIYDQYQKLILQRRAALREYDEAIRDFAMLGSLPVPSKSTLQHINNWLERPEFGQGFLLGSEQNIWQNAMDSPEELLGFDTSASISSALGRVIVTIRQLLSYPFSGDESRIFSVDTSAGSRIMQALSVSIASSLPVVPIIVLFFVKSLLTRIALIFAFTGGFSLALVFGLNMKPDQVLAVTTAIAAIQVVYVGSTGAQST